MIGMIHEHRNVLRLYCYIYLIWPALESKSRDSKIMWKGHPDITNNVKKDVKLNQTKIQQSNRFQLFWGSYVNKEIDFQHKQQGFFSGNGLHLLMGTKLITGLLETS